MVHCRSALGAWNHAQRSFRRGFLARPPVPSDLVHCLEFLPPPPPPPVCGAELAKKRYHWDNCLVEQENDCPSGVVSFLVDAPLSAKDVSLPKILCLSVLLEPDLLDPVAVSSPVAISDTETSTVEKDVPETFSLPSSVYEERNAALLSELRDVKILVASMRLDAEAEVGNLKAEIQEMRLGLEAEVVNLSEACLSSAAALSADCFETAMGPFLEVTKDCAMFAPPCVDGYEGFSVDDVFLGLQSLRVYCFPLPKSFVWNTNAKKFLVPLPENPEESIEDRAMFALPCIEFYSVLLEHVEANKEENRCVIFDDSGDCSLANLRLAHNRLNSCKYTNVQECEDPKPLLCKIMNLIEFVPQNYLKSFSECLLCDLSCMKHFDVMSLELVYSGQASMKRYRFKRSTLSDCDSDDTENYLARNPVACSSNCPACSATWHDCCCTEDYHCTDLTGHSGTYA